jgi:hypothetical protein
MNEIKHLQTQICKLLYNKAELHLNSTVASDFARTSIFLCIQFTIPLILCELSDLWLLGERNELGYPDILQHYIDL